MIHASDLVTDEVLDEAYRWRWSSPGGSSQLGEYVRRWCRWLEAGMPRLGPAG